MVESSHTGQVEHEKHKGVGAGRGVAGGEGEMRVMEGNITIIDASPPSTVVVCDVPRIAVLVCAVETVKVRSTHGDEMRSQPTDRHLGDVRQNHGEKNADDEPSRMVVFARATAEERRSRVCDHNTG